MAYNENIPESFTNPSADQPLIQGNFQEISTAFNTNHGNFNDPDQGKHSFLQMPEQSSAPATSANEMGLYTKESSLTSLAEMFIRRESNGTEIEFTSSLGAANGWTRLPSGILLKWGFVSSGAGAQTVTFPTGGSIPPFVSIFNVQVTVQDTSATPNTFVTINGTPSITSFGTFSSSRTSTTANGATFYYLAIGN